MMRSSHALAVLVLAALPAAVLAADEPFGLSKRIPWNNSKIVGSPDPLSPYKTARVFPNLTIKQPLDLEPEPGTDRLFILHHLGSWAGPTRLIAVKDDQAASETTQLIQLDALSIGMAFHPKYAENGYIYIGQNGPSQKYGTATQVVRYTVDKKAGTIDPKTRQIVIEWPSNGHNGGDVAFGNDGYLYVSSGDGSSDSDRDLTGQTLNDLLACVVRIDVDHPADGKNYGIPKDNPFLDRPNACPELWAYGLRNPWRMSYDKTSGQLWVGQNGQDLWEQVYLIKKGGNYGWSVSEGSHPFHAKRKAGPDPILPPTAEHHHSEARSLTGGQVYRGKANPDLVGAYVYGDWSTGRVWAVKHDGNKQLWHKELVDTPFNITGFGTDHSGELYVIDHNGGFYKFVPTTAEDQPKAKFPTKLSETSLFTSLQTLEPIEAAIKYDVAAPQWADGAVMDRFAILPGNEKIMQKPQLNAGGAWSFPNGTVMIQTLSLDVLDDAGKPVRKKVETRMTTRQQNEWIGYSYRWNDAQTDAELVPAAGTSEVFEVADKKDSSGRRELTWRFPSRTECLACHSRASGFVLGFMPLQLDRDYKYGKVTDNQLRALDHIGMFDEPLKTTPTPRGRRGAASKKSAGQPVKLVNPYDKSKPLEARVKSYLHVNCSTCHVQEGGGNAKMQLDLPSNLERMNIVGIEPLHDRMEIPDAKLVAPGAPERSILFQRVSRRGTGQMPPLVSTEVDHEAVKMLNDWIKGLPKKPK